MLKSTSTALLIEDGRLTDIVIGVPHHAPAGTETLPCPKPRPSDENAGFIGKYIADKLNCCYIIACNYNVDVNKYFKSDYSMQIAKWNPKVLVEIHGHSGKSAKSDIEISSGCSAYDVHSMKLADMLSRKLSTIPILKDISICGEFNKILFKAKDSVTITDGRWLAFHIELPPQLRKASRVRTGRPSKLAYRFCDCLAESLREIVR